MAVPTLNFTLHVPDGMAEGDDEMESLFPHTPRNDASWFEAEPPTELIEQCLRPGHCAVPEGEVREWMHRRLAQIGHASNEGGNILMAHTWFECAYAAKAGSADLISASNMRLKLGQWALVEQLYKQIVRMELSESQREVAERKLAEVTALKGGSAPLPGSSRPSPSDPGSELQSLLAAPTLTAGTLAAGDVERLQQLLRSCGFSANAAGDFEAAHNWFDCSYAVSGALTDLVSSANMRVKLTSTSATAAAIYKHALAAEAQSVAKEKEVAERKLAALESATQTQRAKENARASAAEKNGGDVSYRAYA